VEVAFWPALVAGFIGGAMMVVMRLLMRKAGLELPMDISRIWGTMLELHGATGLLIGLAIHLLGSAGIALIYAWAFDVLGVEDRLLFWGLLGGLIHWFIAGLFFAILPALHPEIPKRQPAPGAFLHHFGIPSVPVFFVGHVMYGVVVAILYGALHQDGGIGVVL
jgi:hypothetical protein